MKKLIQAIAAFALTATLSVNASATTSQTAPATKLEGSLGNNISANDYLTYANTVKSYIEQTDSGFRKIEYYDGKLVIEEYGDNCELLSAKSISQPSYVFGGCYLGEDYNFVVWGKENPEENDENTVLLIEKYAKGWQTSIKNLSVKGINTTAPFDAGSLRMTMVGKALYIHTSHEMYKSNDGYNHQANMTFAVDTATMTVTDSWYEVMNINYGYVSHSFNQFIKSDSEYIYRVDHGDAYPRAVTITKCAVGDKITSVSHTNALSIVGAIGDNFTGVSVGGFELSANNLLIAGNTADQTNSSIGYYSARNIFITVTDKNLSSTAVKYLTSYTDDDDVTVCTPHLVKISDSKFLVMWEEEKDYLTVTRMTAIDENGNLISDIVDTNMRLSDCAPVLFSDGLVYWFVSSGESVTLYCVNPENLANAN
ncbi:MAG: hypothetical protein IKT78_04665, partial [Ruminiclostridium sp.]|nr:hypothetical protein [Ruminiclostridium sp.]